MANLETVKRRATVNLNPSRAPQYIDVSQYDSGYIIVFDIIEEYSSALRYAMQDANTTIIATLQGVKPSGAGYQTQFSQFTEPYEIEFPLTADMTDEAGDILSEIVFYITDENETTQRVATANFVLRVKKSPYPVTDDNNEGE